MFSIVFTILKHAGNLNSHDLDFIIEKGDEIYKSMNPSDDSEASIVFSVYKRRFASLYPSIYYAYKSLVVFRLIRNSLLISNVQYLLCFYQIEILFFGVNSFNLEFLKNFVYVFISMTFIF